jgi:beta-lactamase regulating signal transducer with metallopeptidase domain
MSSVETILTDPIFQTLGWTLLHFIWQGSLVAALYALLAIWLRDSSSNLRYGAACLAMLLMLAFPIATGFVIDSSITRSQISENTATATTPNLESHLSIKESSGFGSKEALSAARTDSNPRSLIMYIQGWTREQMPNFLPALVSIWLLGVSLLSFRFLGGWLIAHRLRGTETILVLHEWQEKVEQLSRRLKLSRPVRVCESLIAEVPTVVGWLRPVILLPASALSGLSEEQIEAILAHELAHIRRHDYLVNMLQTAVETLLFYHPGIWWLSRQIRIERENCCDDMAVAVCGDVLTYARALTALEELRAYTPELAVAATGGSLLQRIERLIKVSPSSHRPSTWSAGLIVIATIFSICAGAQTIFVRVKIDHAYTQPSAENSVSDNQVSTKEWKIAEEKNGEFSSTQSINRQSGKSTADEKETGLNDIASKEQDERDETDQLSSVEQSDQKEWQEFGDFNDQLAAVGFAKLTVDQIFALKTYNVTSEFIEEIRLLGYNNLTVDDLIGMKIQGVTPEFIRSIKMLGYNPSIDALIGMKIQGVSSGYVQAIKALGLNNVSVDELIGMRIQGVTPEYIKMMQEYGFTDLNVDQLISMRIHGVTVSFIQENKALGFGNLSVDELISMRIHGVTPEYVRLVKGIGYNPSPDQLISMRIHGVTPEFIKEISEQGFPNLSINKLIELRIHGVTPVFIKEAKARGFNDLSIDQMIKLKIGQMFQQESPRVLIKIRENTNEK